MPDAKPETLTEQQKKWFASVRDSMVRETGKSLDQWVEIARACPETAHRARLRWFKDNHGLGQNRASLVLGAAFPSGASWSQPEGLRETLWKDPAARAVLIAVEARLQAFPDLVTGQRKGFSAWSRRYQFAAMRPVKGGAVLGLAVPPSADPRLEPRTAKDGWSERLTARLPLSSPAEVDASVEALLSQAFDRS